MHAVTRWKTGKCNHDWKASSIHPHTPAHTACLQSSMNWVEPAGRFKTWLFLSLQSTEDKSMDIFHLVEWPSSWHTLLLVNWVMVLSRQCAESHDKPPWCTAAFKSLTKVPRKHARLLQTSCPLHSCPRVLWWVTIYYYVLYTLLPPYQTLISINIFSSCLATEYVNHWGEIAARVIIW